NEKRQGLLEFISPKTVIFLKNKELLYGTLNKLFKKATQAHEQAQGEVGRAGPEALFMASAVVQQQLSTFVRVSLSDSLNKKPSLKKAP
ncbi:MAG: hypothetical protein ACPGU0_06330, partial [Marinirhabdus sp.]